MASSFSIQDILTHNTNKTTSSGNNPSSYFSSPPQPTSNHPATVAIQKRKPPVPLPEMVESDSCAESKSRKRSREFERSSSSEMSSYSNEGTRSVHSYRNEVFPNTSDSDHDSISPTYSSVEREDGELEGRRRPKRPRTAFTPTQLKGLEYYFRICPYPDSMGRDVISRVTGVDDTRIQVWFQNRRARYRKREQPLSKPSSVSPTNSPTVSSPPLPRVDQTHKGPSSSSPLPLIPTTPPIPTPSPFTPEMLGPYYAAAMAYHMQQARSKLAPSVVPTFPSLLPFPFFFPMTPNQPNTRQRENADN